VDALRKEDRKVLDNWRLKKKLFPSLFLRKDENKKVFFVETKDYFVQTNSGTFWHVTRHSA